MSSSASAKANQVNANQVANSPCEGAKRKRTKTGCSICRARKIKCDERQQGGCVNCERLSLECPGYGNDASTPLRQRHAGSSDFTEAGIKRQRIRQSCENCRVSKTRCSGDKPACSRCTKKGLNCIYEGSAAPIHARTQGAHSFVNAPVVNHGHNGGSASEIGADSYADDHSLSWLWAPGLPDEAHIRCLVEEYFANIHPLRCFGFIHKPSFMQKLDSGPVSRGNDDALLHVMCALGAKFFALKQGILQGLPSKKVQALGIQWADTARQQLLAALGTISIEHLMTAVLLQDHCIRQGDYPLAFVMTGIMTRMSQALQINLEFSADVLCLDTACTPSATAKESRRRLMWSCYVADASIGSGVDQLTLLHERDIKIQLPCDERQFLLQKPCLTEILQPGQVLKFVDQALLQNDPAEKMGIQAYYIRLTEIRKRLLTYLKQLDTASPPWLAESEFANLDNECRRWYSDLPNSLQFTPAAIYIRSETGEFGALCSLHVTYHLTTIDLYRIFVPALYKLRGAFTFPREHQGFVRQHQRAIYAHARSLAEITKEAMSRIGPRALADFWWPTVLFESCRHMVYQETQLSESFQSRALKPETVELVRSNIQVLRTLQCMYAMAEPLYIRASKLLETAESGPSHDVDDLESNPSAPGTPAQSAPDYVLHPLSIYRMARKGIPEKHAPEKTTSPMATHTSPASTAQYTHPDLVQSPEFSYPSGPNPMSSAQSDMSQQNRGQTQVPDFGEQSSNLLEQELQLFFPPDLTTFWQPAETVAGNGYATDLPPWMTGYQQGDAYLDFWPGNQ